MPNIQISILTSFSYLESEHTLTCMNLSRVHKRDRSSASPYAAPVLERSLHILGGVGPRAPSSYVRPHRRLGALRGSSVGGCGHPHPTGPGLTDSPPTSHVRGVL